MIKIIKIGATWCATCQTTEATFKAFAAKHNEIETETLDAEIDAEKVNALNVKTIPCLVFYIDGKETMRRTGGFSSEQLELWLKSCGGQ